MSIKVLKYKQPLYEAFDFDDDSVDSLAQSSIQTAKKNSYIGVFKKKVEETLDEDDYIDMTLPENLIDDVMPEINAYLKGLIDGVNVPEIRIIVGKPHINSLVNVYPYEIDLDNINAKSQLADLCNMVERVYEKYYNTKLELTSFFPLINFKFKDYKSFKTIAKSLGFLSLFSYWFYLNGKKQTLEFSWSKYPSSYVGYKSALDGDDSLMKMISSRLDEEEIEIFQKEFTEGYDKAYTFLLEEGRRQYL